MYSTHVCIRTTWPDSTMSVQYGPDLLQDVTHGTKYANSHNSSSFGKNARISLELSPVLEMSSIPTR